MARTVVPIRARVYRTIGLRCATMIRTAKPRTRKGGAKPATLGALRDRNEQRHQAALAAGSPWALQTERRRQRAAATAVDAAAQGVTPTAGDATPPGDPPQGDAGGARPSMARRLLREGLTALIRPPRSSSGS